MFIKSLQIIAVVALATIVLIDPAFATSTASGIFGKAQQKAVGTFENVKNIIFVVGGFGLVGLAFGAIFGRVNWKWFAALAVGLLILAAAGAIVTYSTTSTETGGSAITDTFK